MDYFNNLKRIENALLVLDKTDYSTIEEVNKSLVEYDKLQDEIVLINKQIIENQIVYSINKEKLYEEAFEY